MLEKLPFKSEWFRVDQLICKLMRARDKVIEALRKRQFDAYARERGFKDWKEYVRRTILAGEIDLNG